MGLSCDHEITEMIGMSYLKCLECGKIYKTNDYVDIVFEK